MLTVFFGMVIVFNIGRNIETAKVPKVLPDDDEEIGSALARVVNEVVSLAAVFIVAWIVTTLLGLP